VKLISITTLLTTAALAIASPALSADYTLSINTALTTDDPLYKGLESFRDSVSERTNGARSSFSQIRSSVPMRMSSSRPAPARRLRSSSTADASPSSKRNLAFSALLISRQVMTGCVRS
jgi:hypothetical protein